MIRRILFTLLAFVASGTIASAQESNDGKQIWADSFLNKKAPELYVQEWLTNKPDIKGKFVLIDFWATWCGPCRKAIPELNKFAEEFKDKLVVIGISNEPKATILKMETPKIDYFVGRDSTKKMAGALKVKGIPHVILMDPSWTVRWEGFPELPGHELTAEKIKSLMEKYK